MVREFFLGKTNLVKKIVSRLPDWIPPFSNSLGEGGRGVLVALFPNMPPVIINQKLIFSMLEILLTKGDGDALVHLQGSVHALEVLVAVT